MVSVIKTLIVSELQFALDGPRGPLPAMKTFRPSALQYHQSTLYQVPRWMFKVHLTGSEGFERRRMSEVRVLAEL